MNNSQILFNQPPEFFLLKAIYATVNKSAWMVLSKNKDFNHIGLCPSLQVEIESTIATFF